MSTRVSLVVLVAGGIVLFCLVGIMQWIASSELREELIEDNNTLAAFIIHNIDSVMEDYQRMLMAEAGKSTIVKAVITPEDSGYYIRDYLDEVASNFTDSELYLYAFDGMPVLEQTPSIFTDNTVKVVLNVIENMAPEIILNEDNTENTTVYFVVPVIYGRHAEGALVAGVPFSSIFEREVRIEDIDPRINIVAKRKTQILSELRENMDNSISSSSASKIIPLKIAVEMPKDVIDEPLFKMELSMGVIGALIIFATVLGLNYLVKRMIIYPITRLRKGVSGIVEDGWRIIPEVEGEAEEIDVLVRAFNSMQNSLKERTAMLLQAEKLSSIGQLAAGVAHEINNPASYVVSNLETLRRYVEGMLEMLLVCREKVIASNCRDSEIVAAVKELEEVQQRIDLSYIEEDIGELITETLDGMNRISKIVVGLKDFSHKDSGDELLECNLSKIIDKAISIAWNELKYKCTLHKDYADSLSIFVYEGKMSQVVLNLLVNAAQAIEKKGNIYIKTYIEGNYAVIEVRDDGSGMSEEVRNMIFDPFFTTKPVGTGTGLGLHICHKILSEIGGSIEVESEVGVGTLFRVLLPFKQCLLYSI